MIEVKFARKACLVADIKLAGGSAFAVRQVTFRARAAIKQEQGSFGEIA